MRAIPTSVHKSLLVHMILHVILLNIRFFVRLYYAADISYYFLRICMPLSVYISLLVSPWNIRPSEKVQRVI